MAQVATTDVMTNANTSSEVGVSGKCVVSYAGKVYTYESAADRVQSVDYLAEEARLTDRFVEVVDNG